MNTVYLQYILTVAECRSMSKAGQQLNLKQQYLSHVVKSVEEEFNIEIFQRHSRGLSITEDGYVFLNHAKQVISLINKMHMQYLYPSKQDDRNEQQILHLQVAPMLYPNLVNKSIATYQKLNTQTKINYIENYLEDSIPCIMSNPYTISLQVSRYPLDQLREILPPQIKIIKLGPTALSVLTSREVAQELNLKSISLAELVHKELIAFAPKGVEESAVYQTLLPYGEPDITLTAENSMVFLNLIETGNYFTIGSSRIANVNKNIVAIPISEFITNPLWNVALIQEEMFQTPAIRDFLNILLMEADIPTL